VRNRSPGALPVSFLRRWTEGPLSRVLVTGGAGFIGSNLVSRLIEQGHEVTVLDNLSRAGSTANLEFLRHKYGSGSFRFLCAGVEKLDPLLDAADGMERIYHLASQVAVTDSVDNPLRDFADNALGTVHVLEAARRAGHDPVLVYSSTNKVYGSMESVGFVEEPTRYRYRDLPMGIPETQPADFHSPYGCSKGCGDQYTRDYYRIYGLRTVVFRQSCIYGPGQFGLESQGWLCWLILAALWQRPITIFGDGKQVRDVLHVGDLLNVYDAAVENIRVSAGEIFNVGGGPENTVSIWAECGPLIEKLVGRPVPVTFAPWRPGDQRVYVSDIRKAMRLLRWKPQKPLEQGIRELFEWILGHEAVLSTAIRSGPVEAGPASSLE
jgi:CDP-paratose 2-epimerase